MTKTRDIEMTVELAARAADVFRAISEGDEIAKWFAPDARVTHGDQPTLFVSWGEGMGAEEPITVFDPPRRLRYRFGDDLFVDWSLEEHGTKTRLRMIHSGFSTAPETDGEYESNQRGWRIFLLNLRHYVEDHAGKRAAQCPFVILTPAPREHVWRHVVALDRERELAGQEEGKHYRLVLVPGRALSGTVEIFAPARDLALTIADIDEHDPRSLRGEQIELPPDEGLLRISLEKTKTGTMIYGVVLAYGEAASTAEIASALRAALSATM
jgi:uncharacterized protein YndB with AHSA1/START domain